MTTRVRLALASACCFAALASSAQAAVSVRGVVRDASGAPVADAQLEVHALDLGQDGGPVATARSGADGAYALTADEAAVGAGDGVANLMLIASDQRLAVPRFLVWRPAGFDVAGLLLRQAPGALEADVDLSARAPGAMRRTRAARLTAPAVFCARKALPDVRAWTPVAEVWVTRNLDAEFRMSTASQIEVGMSGMGFSALSSDGSTSSVSKVLRGPRERRVINAAVQYERTRVTCTRSRPRDYLTGGKWLGGLQKGRVLPPRAVCRGRDPKDMAILGWGETAVRARSATLTLGAALRVGGYAVDVRTTHTRGMETTWKADGRKGIRRVLCADKPGVSWLDAGRVFAGPNIRG